VFPARGASVVVDAHAHRRTSAWKIMMGPALAKGRVKAVMKPKARRPGQRSGGRMPAFQR
jgi:hypothetical protein